MDLASCRQVSVQLGDLCDEATIKKLVDPEGCTHVTTIHLAALLSGYAEDNFDLGMKVRISSSLCSQNQALPRPWPYA